MSTEKERAEVLEWMQREIDIAVRAGFEDRNVIAEQAAEYNETDEVPNFYLLPHARQMLDEAIAKQRDEQRSWPLVTDFDRLLRAFDRLERDGVVCRHNFSCCGTCASGEIWDEIEQERGSGRQIRGAAHYNVQDTEGAVDGDGLHFSYASVAEGDEALKAIGREIVDALMAEGFDVTWNGETSTRMHIAMDWKRRIPG